MSLELEITGRATFLNEYINAERRNRFIASKIKKDETEAVVSQTLKHAGKVTEFPVNIIFTWHVVPKRGKYPDPDNVSFAQKFVLDGLVKAGVLPDDTREYIESLMHQFVWDGDVDKIVVGIY